MHQICANYPYTLSFQINIPQELADEIMDTAQNGLIERGLFHDAAVATFSVLLYCWKK